MCARVTTHGQAWLIMFQNAAKGSLRLARGRRTCGVNIFPILLMIISLLFVSESQDGALARAQIRRPHETQNGSGNR